MFRKSSIKVGREERELREKESMTEGVDESEKRRELKQTYMQTTDILKVFHVCKFMKVLRELLFNEGRFLISSNVLLLRTCRV